MWLDTIGFRRTERPTNGASPRFKRYLSVMGLVLLGTIVSAWLQLLPAQADDAIGSGAKVHPIAALPLRTSPPEGFLGTTGSVVAQTDPAHTYFVVGEKTIQTVAGQQMWLNVKDMTSNQVGWIYTGSGNQPFQNVTRIP